MLHPFDSPRMVTKNNNWAFKLYYLFLIINVSSDISLTLVDYRKRP